jgi:predicted nucleic-acid-binding Zn-ribbon protein
MSEENNNLNSLSPQELEQISTILKQRNANLPCPRCGNNDFLLHNYYQFTLLGDHTAKVNLINFTAIPTAVLICSNCGFLSLHSLGVLGLLPSVKPTETQ